MTELLKVRNVAKAKKPKFIRQDAHRLPKLAQNWRKPRGRHSKMRFRLRGYRKRPAVGYSSPKEVRGLTRDGHEMLIVNRVEDMEGVTTPIVIGANVGQKKRIEIIKKAFELKLDVLNIKDADGYLKKVEDSIKKKKAEIEKKKEKAKKKKAKEKEKKDAKGKKESKESKDLEEKKISKEEIQKRKIIEKKE